MRPLFMLTTELISIPTGFLFLVTLGTLWKAKMRFEPPMLFCLGMLFNFLIGGITGVFLSDVPVERDGARELLRDGPLPLHDHGRAHLRVLRRAVLLAAEDDGRDSLSRRLSVWHFWAMFVFFNLTFFPLFFVGILGQPRRVFDVRRRTSRRWNDVSSIGAYLLGASFFIFIINFVWSIFIDPKRAPQNPWSSLGLEWQTPTPVPWYNFVRIPIVLVGPLPLRGA